MEKATIIVQDLKTKQKFRVGATWDRALLETSDGVKVKIHPVALRTMTKRGQTFNGTTVYGPREMRLL